MKAYSPSSNAERAGERLGYAWRALVRWDDRINDSIIGKGASRLTASALLWTIKLIVLAIVLYLAFWLALFLVFVASAAWILRNSNLDAKPRNPEWREGLLGFGLYDQVGHRIDPHDPTEDR